MADTLHSQPAVWENIGRALKKYLHGSQNPSANERKWRWALREKRKREAEEDTERRREREREGARERENTNNRTV